MKRIATALAVLMTISTPALAYGPTIQLPSLDFPQDTATISTQNCEASAATTPACE